MNLNSIERNFQFRIWWQIRLFILFIFVVDSSLWWSDLLPWPGHAHKCVCLHLINATRYTSVDLSLLCHHFSRSTVEYEWIYLSTWNDKKKDRNIYLTNRRLDRVCRKKINVNIVELSLLSFLGSLSLGHLTKHKMPHNDRKVGKCFIYSREILFNRTMTVIGIDCCLRQFPTIWFAFPLTMNEGSAVKFSELSLHQNAMHHIRSRMHSFRVEIDLNI